MHIKQTETETLEKEEKEVMVEAKKEVAAHTRVSTI